MKKKLKLGVIGMSEGNGHPYSWSAICNGFVPEIMKSCPFPVIADYLSKEKFPDNFLVHQAEVTHIWTQDKQVSAHISAASKIANIVSNPVDMIPDIDALLLARDDAEHHAEMVAPFIQAGLPVFIDKPLCLSVNEANKLFQSQQFNHQIFTCSSLRYAKELLLSKDESERLGKIIWIEACIPKSWSKYAIHLIEPIVAGNPDRGELISVETKIQQDIVHAHIKWKQLEAAVSTYGKYPMPLQIRYFGENGMETKQLNDTFNAFKISIESFLNQINSAEQLIPREETLEIIQIIEAGHHA
jgi:predicted dehydrogenase